MKKVIVALSAAALIAATPAVMAMGTSSKTHMHQKKGHHGASARASEQQMKGSKTGSPGASNSAPGQTTGSNTKP